MNMENEIIVEASVVKMQPQNRCRVHIKSRIEARKRLNSRQRHRIFMKSPGIGYAKLNSPEAWIISKVTITV